MHHAAIIHTLARIYLITQTNLISIHTHSADAKSVSIHKAGRVDLGSNFPLMLCRAHTEGAPDARLLLQSICQL